MTVYLVRHARAGDRHDWGATMRVPAVVGSYPEPFVHGAGGKRLPVRIECADSNGPDCARVNDALTDRPELVNDDCWGGAWMIAIAPKDAGAAGALLDAAAYEQLLKESH